RTLRYAKQEGVNLYVKLVLLLKMLTVNEKAIFYFRYALLWFTALGYISVGILHFVNKDFFMCIMPPYIPF
mgnify:CR=1